MIIDCHGHVSAPAAAVGLQGRAAAARGSHGRGGVKVTDDEMRAALKPPRSAQGPSRRARRATAPTCSSSLRGRSSSCTARSRRRSCTGSPRSATTSSTARRRCIPDKFFGVAGLPQPAGDPIERGAPGTRALREGARLRRLPAQSRSYENSGVEPPALGDRYWYPLYEKLCELDIPAHIHTASSRSERASYSVHLINEGTIAILGLLNSDVFKDFPSLKIVVSHGGGAIPYQLGRFDAPSLRGRGATRFRDRLKLLYFDTVLYTAAALELLIKTVGPDRCLFGSECPGVGSAIDPDTGQHDGQHPAAHRKIRMAVGRPTAIRSSPATRARCSSSRSERRAGRIGGNGMAKIVLAMATTHGPQLHTSVEQWQLRVKADKARKHPFRNGVYGFDELVAMRRPKGSTRSRRWRRSAAITPRCHAAHGDARGQMGGGRRRRRGDPRQRPGRDLRDRAAQSGLHGVLRRDDSQLSAVGGARRRTCRPASRKPSTATRREAYTEYRGVPDLGAHIIETLVENEFDVAASKVWPKHARNGASHAFGHIYRQVMRDKVVPNVPIYQNTFFPPNQPTARRVLSVRPDRQARRSIAGRPTSSVAVFASGGMSHFVIDEEFDRAFVEALQEARQGLSDVDSAEGAAVRHVGAEVVDFARRRAGRHRCRHARDRLRAVLSLAGRHRHGQRVLLVGHERPMRSDAARLYRPR